MSSEPSEAQSVLAQMLKQLVVAVAVNNTTTNDNDHNDQTNNDNDNNDNDNNDTVRWSYEYRWREAGPGGRLSIANRLLVTGVAFLRMALTSVSAVCHFAVLPFSDLRFNDHHFNDVHFNDLPFNDLHFNNRSNDLHFTTLLETRKPLERGMGTSLQFSECMKLRLLK